MPKRNVKAACASARDGCKWRASAELDEEPDDHPQQSEARNNREQNFRPISRFASNTSRAIDPSIPVFALRAGGTMIVPHASSEACAFIDGPAWLHEKRMSGDSRRWHAKWKARIGGMTMRESARPHCGRALSAGSRGNLLRVVDLRSGRGFSLDFLELWQRAELRRLGIAGAAAGCGHQGDAGEDECGGDAGHGCEGDVWSVRGSLGLFRGACLRRLVPDSENFSSS